MGFETWRVYGDQRVETDFEAVPMGFETSIGSGEYGVLRILKQSLWDLKRI